MSERRLAAPRVIVLLMTGFGALAAAPFAAPQTTATGSAKVQPSGCRILPYQPSEDDPVEEFSWYGTPADVRGGALCRFSIGPDLPPYLFYLDADRFDQFNKIRVHGVDGREIQTIGLPPTITPPPGVDYLRADDVNFDGYRDIGLLVDYTPPGNGWYQYFLFDRRSGTFRENPDPTRLVNPTTHLAAQEVVTRSTNGFRGKAYTERRYRFEEGALELVGEVRQEVVDEHIVRVVLERKNATITETGRRIVPAPELGPYDRSAWEVVRTRAVGFGPSLPRAQVILLQSRWVTGGVDSPLRDVNVVIAAGNHALYSFRTDAPRFDRQADLRFSVDDGVDVKDVTGDGVPEIIFGAGAVGTSGYAERYHIIHYDRARRAFRDVASEDLERGLLTSLRWLAIGDAHVALLAEARVAGNECHLCAHFYKYRASCWSEERGGFRRIYRGRSRRRYGDDGSLGEELPLILPSIHRAAAGSCSGTETARRPSPAPPAAASPRTSDGVEGTGNGSSNRREPHSRTDVPGGLADGSLRTGWSRSSPGARAPTDPRRTASPG